MNFEDQLDQVLFEQPDLTVRGVSAPGIETDVHKAEPVGAAAKNKIKVDGKWEKMPKGDSKETQMIKSIAQILDKKFGEFFDQFKGLGSTA
jgi:hypothetical protein